MVQGCTAVRQVTPDSPWRESSCLAEVCLVTPEYIAHATLQDSGSLVVAEPEHLQKMVQSGPIAPQMTTDSWAVAICQPLIQELLDMRLADLPPP